MSLTNKGAIVMAMMREPMTLEDHANSRLISDPLLLVRAADNDAVVRIEPSGARLPPTPSLGRYDAFAV